MDLLLSVQKWIHTALTYSVSFTKMACDHNVHVVILTHVELQQIDFNFTVLDKHAMFNNLEKKRKNVAAWFLRAE